MTKLPKFPAHKGLKAPSPKVVQSHFHVANSIGNTQQNFCGKWHSTFLMCKKWHT
jgi:hypothetical protein